MERPKVQCFLSTKKEVAKFGVREHSPELTQAKVEAMIGTHSWSVAECDI